MDYESIAKELTEKLFLSRGSDAMKDFSRFSKGEMFLLNCLCEQSHPVLPGHLSAVMGISAARIATILNSLESKGLIERNIDKKDRRKILVTITEAGRTQVHEKRKLMYEGFAATLREMGEEDARAFVRLLSRFIGIAKRIHDGENECCAESTSAAEIGRRGTETECRDAGKQENTGRGTENKPPKTRRMTR